MKWLQSSWLPCTLGVAILLTVWSGINSSHPGAIVLPQKTFDDRTEEWVAPDINTLPENNSTELILYGKDLIDHTSYYFGPNGTIARITNGMNCSNCHLKSGTVLYGNPFSAVAATYPKYRHRSGRVESVSFRVNECMQRSLNGKPIDTNSHEMKAFIAYLEWMGKDVPKEFRPKGTGIELLPFLSRAADPEKGREIFSSNCARCHGADGAGTISNRGDGYEYPPLWGDHSYNVSAGMFTITKLAGFIKNNMPYDRASYDNPVLSNEQSWDVAAYILSQPRPKIFFAYDWQNIAKKPVDYPFGPYSDSFSEQQHKFGPFAGMKNR